MKTPHKKIDIPDEGKIAILGGDSREIAVAKALLDEGWQVAVYGRPAHVVPDEAQVCASSAQALAGARAVILPAPPVKDGGRLYNAEGLELTVSAWDFAGLASGTPLLAGVVSPFTRQLATDYRLKVVETLEFDEIALPFAVATAEGAIAIAISANGEVLDQAQALIIGYGRIGRELAPRLRGLGMRVLVANRGTHRLAQAVSEGYDTVSWPGWPQAAAKSAFIFNTAPHLLLDAQSLSILPQETVIIDLAAAPGGTDFALANKLGIYAVLAGGLPGKYAPRFAGAVMAEHYPRLIKAAITEQLNNGGRE